MTVVSPAGGDRMPHGRPPRPAIPVPAASPIDIEQTAGRRFESIVRDHSERVAVRMNGEDWTYAKLDALACRVARTLQNAPDRDRPVALWLSAGPALFAAMLGALKAGRFYVPLDPALGDGHLQAILGEADAAEILTDARGSADAKRWGSGARILRVDEIGDDGPAVEPAGSPDDLAYVLFTSGSTGRPKGVMQTHRNLLHNILKLSNGLGIVPDDRFTLLTSCSFGASVSDVFGALLNGAAVCPYTVSAGGLPGLRRFLVEERITILHCVPSLFRQLAGALDGSEDLSPLRLIKLGGEPVLSSDFELYRRRFPRHCVFHVGLGSTEVHVTRQWFADHDSECPAPMAPLGYAVDGTEVILLDPSGRPSTTDEGEIAVIARTLPPGYWKRPDLTAGAFVPAPAGDGRRMFRTGDLGRLLPDGCLLYVGRRDARVKVRGQWVDLAEVEAVLNSLPGVREAAVVAREGPAGTRLVAYLSASGSGRPEVSVVRRALSRRLAPHMVPARFVFVGALARTPNGKIDRGALPGSAASRPELEVSFVAPRNAAEEKIARIWREILGLEQVGVHDDFFDLGGDSLLAMQLALELERESRVEISPAILLRAPTVAALAQRIGKRRRSRDPLSSLVPIEPRGARPPFFCVHPIGGIPFYQPLARIVGADQPFYGLQSRGFDGTRPLETVEEMAALYVEEIRRIQPEGPYYLGGHSFGGTIAFEMARQLKARNQSTAVLALFDTPNFHLPLAPAPLSPEFLRRRARFHFESLKQVRPVKKLVYLLQRARTALLLPAPLIARGVTNGYEALFHPLRRAHRRVREANHRAARTYVPSFYAGRVTLFRASGRLEERPHEKGLTPALGWEALCGGGVEIHDVPGGHTSLLEGEENIRAIGEKLRECLRRAQEAEARES